MHENDETIVNHMNSFLEEIKKIKQQKREKI